LKTRRPTKRLGTLEEEIVPVSVWIERTGI